MLGEGFRFVLVYRLVFEFVGFVEVVLVFKDWLFSEGLSFLRRILRFGKVGFLCLISYCFSIIRIVSN